MSLYLFTSYPENMNEMTRNEKDQSVTIDQPGVYRMKIQGRLSEGAIRRFDEMVVSVEANAAGVPITTLTGQITDQAALHGIVARIRDLGLPLLLVELVGTVNKGG
jgi:hypothetical protein